MTNQLHRLEDHSSYHLHRKQLWTQILLPILIAVLVFVAVIIVTSLAAFRANGDVSRWAAISTVWLVLPVIFVGLVFLILLIAMIYLMARVSSLIPPYSYQAQRIVYRFEGGAKRAAEMVRKPVLALQELAELIKAYIEKVRERK